MNGELLKNKLINAAIILGKCTDNVTLDTYRNADLIYNDIKLLRVCIEDAEKLMSNIKDENSERPAEK